MNQDPGKKRGMSKNLAEYLGINPSLVSQILTSDKHFTEEQIVLLNEYFGLPTLESKYLLTLVQSERAGSVKLKKYFIEDLNLIRQQALDLTKRANVGLKLSDKEQAQFYSSWLYSAIHLYTTIDKPVHFNSICERFRISAERAHEIVQFLLKHRLILEQQGQFVPGPTETHLPKNSSYVTTYHRLWRQKSIQIAERLQSEEYMYSCNFSVSKKDFLKIREDVVALTKKFLQTAQSSPAEELAQFNIDLFWLVD